MQQPPPKAEVRSGGVRLLLSTNATANAAGADALPFHAVGECERVRAGREETAAFVEEQRGE